MQRQIKFHLMSLLSIMSLPIIAGQARYLTLGSTININSPDASTFDIAYNQKISQYNSYSIGLHPSAYTESIASNKNTTFNVGLSGEYKTKNLLIKGLSTGFGLVATVLTGEKDSKTLNNSYASKVYMSSSVPIGMDCFAKNTLGISTSRKQPDGGTRIDTNKYGAPTLGISCVLK